MIADLVNAATAFVGQLSTFDEWKVLLITFVSTGIEMTFLAGLLVPGESVVMLAGSLPHGPVGVAAAVVAGTAGGLTGQICGYAVGRAFGPRLRGTRLGRRIGAERFDRAEAYLRDRGAPALVAVRFVAVIHAVVPIVAGIVRMPFGRFLGWSALGTALWVGAFAGLGALTAGADTTGGVTVVLTAIGATCLGVVPLGARLIRRAFAGRSAKTRAGAVDGLSTDGLATDELALEGLGQHGLGRDRLGPGWLGLEGLGLDGLGRSALVSGGQDEVAARGPGVGAVA
ncbi:DedA family protein [Paractinoplanes globisporus]|uniref:DedA family protein n=1 Tax=Paractinoplanes globisporus TaxID=113565 RepID=A0ABW6W936_9ACTN|nr:DedA family protein [Actinoplanes globisporus]